MPVDPKEALRQKIKNGLKELVSQAMPADEAVALYNECVQHYRALLHRTEDRSERSHLRGLLYLHNVNNMAKISAIFMKGVTGPLHCYSGDMLLRDRLEDFFTAVDSAAGSGSIRRFDDDASMGMKHLYLYTFRTGPQEISVMSATNSLYFEEERFGRLCGIIERLFAYRHAASLPRHADSMRSLRASLQSIIKSGAGTPQFLLYSINRVTQVLAHMTSFDLVRIHEMVYQYLVESYPEATAVITVSIFRYIVIAGNVAKPVTSMAFGGTTIPLTVQRHSIENESSLYKILWEA